MEFASVCVPGDTVVAVAVLLDMYTLVVPETVRPVYKEVSQTVPVPFVTIFPLLPNDNPLVFPFELEKRPQVRVAEFVPTSSVPKVSVNVAVDGMVKLSIS